MLAVRLAKRLSSKEMEWEARVHNLNEAVCVSLRANALGKGTNPSPTHQL